MTEHSNLYLGEVKAKLEKIITLVDLDLLTKTEGLNLMDGFFSGLDLVLHLVPEKGEEFTQIIGAIKEFKKTAIDSKQKPVSFMKRKEDAKTILNDTIQLIERMLTNDKETEGQSK
jgi:hypothetical protein